MGLLDGKVAIITGAGGGIGRCHALQFAQDGARVVVNDLGSSVDGLGGARSMADQVVDEIKAQGGEAVANYDSVASYEGAQGILTTALEKYGRADILVNNAGILRDKTLLKLEEDNFDLVVAVHLKGTFLCTQAFARHVKERADQGDPGGRIINTSSFAGLKGNFGQTNYAAAKAGIYGMTLVWAQELARLGVTVNCLAPMAKTRMTENLDIVPDTMQPMHISPMARFLASDLAKDVNGRVFGIHGQQLLEYKMLMTDGVTKEGQALWTPQEIAAGLDEIGAEAPPPAAVAVAPAAPRSDGQVIARAFTLMPQVFLPEKAGAWKACVQFDIQGGQPWTVSIADGQCSTQEGKHGSPTCVVTVDEKTYAAVVLGKEKAEKAFMAGKIRATNLADMMKFGAAFDMRKAKQLAEQAAPATPAPAPVGPPSDGQVIARAFTLMPQVFLPEKAGAWKACVQFDIQGGQPWTVSIADGQCSTQEGKHGSPTCVVTVDEKTYAAVVLGKEKAEKAFMAGKIRATNLADMMKFGAAFDMRKAKQLAEQAAPSGAVSAVAAPTSPGAGQPEGDVLTRGFQLLAQTFRAGAVQDWEARLQFEISGGDDWAVRVSEGHCQVERGRVEDPTCVVKTNREDYTRVLSGELKAEQAFLKGRISASNLSEMMRFGRAFDMQRLQELLRSAPAPSSSPPAATTLNQACVGRVHTGEEPLWVRPEHVSLFAAATEDPNPAYSGSPQTALAPPLFSVRLFKDVLLKAVTDPELGADLLRLVHGEQDMEFLQPLHPWDLCATRIEVKDITAKSSGELLTLEERVYSGGKLAVRVKASMFIRGSGAKKKGGQAGEENPAPPKLAFSEQQTVAADQSLRYAEASLDNNPIHTDDEVARLAGFNGVILQGLCSMAFAGKAFVDHAAGGNPARLARLAVRFSKPVLMGDVLTTEAWRTDERDDVTVYGFRVVNQDGTPVITNGVAEIRPART